MAAGLAVAVKLRLKSGHRLLILNAPEGYIEMISRELPPGVAPETEAVPGVRYDAVQVFARDRRQLEDDWSEALAAVKHDGLFWVAYPKLSSALAGNLNRDMLWQIGLDAGMDTVAAVAVDETWTAMRFRPSTAPGNRKGRAGGRDCPVSGVVTQHLTAPARRPWGGGGGR